MSHEVPGSHRPSLMCLSSAGASYLAGSAAEAHGPRKPASRGSGGAKLESLGGRVVPAIKGQALKDHKESIREKK